ncbi:catalase family peroxidase [Paraburkholderia sp. LEh10]|jgi:catalase|uniref:catalase family peroxidase n=1 Tax=Paraburkholderia sp. LEh10 TaxID=2821353 RepID=UPI001AE6156F|nr:catalase family peroxidase [Paraburkholderia sp. LEh10]MBP0595811.1 catalase family peroxidase [Paraburkholderia sp. LEh10]
MNSKSGPGSTHCVPCRFAAIGVAVLGLAGAFAYTAGWLTPSRLSTYGIINQFEANGGPHPGYRRNHAKGLCVEGYFESNGNAAAISRAEVFAPGRTPIIGRFAIPGSNPSVPDASVPVRSMGLLFKQRDAEQWRTAMNSTPVFAVHTPAQFYQQLVAAQPDPKTGRPDPAKLKAFYAANPETKPFQEWVKTHPASSSLANAAYYGINAFRFIDAGGHEHAVRWSVEPQTPYAPVDAQEKNDPDFLSKQLDEQLKHGNVRWRLIVTVASPGDPTDDATQQWPADRQHIDAGTIVVERSSPQADGVCRDVNFDPTILPDGIKPSDDPLLAARSAAYAVSYQRRTREEALNAAPATPTP